MFEQFKTRRPVARGDVDPVEQACRTLMTYGCVTSWPIGHDEQVQVLKRARRRTHPDILDGDRGRWDEVEEAARVLRLSVR